MADFGVKVSTSGNSATAATGAQLVLTSKYPLAKLDRLNPASFSNIHVTFLHDVPVGETLIYTLKHGYKYRPTVWHLIQIVGIAAPYTDFGFIMDSGTMLEGPGTTGGYQYVAVYTKWDETNIYYYVNKRVASLVVTPFSAVTVAGMALRIRTYAFVEDIKM
jgi:hypothetical protein